MERVHYYTCYCPIGEYYHGEQTQTDMSDLPLRKKKRAVGGAMNEIVLK